MKKIDTRSRDMMHGSALALHWWVFAYVACPLGMTFYISVESLKFGFERLARYVVFCYVIVWYIMHFSSIVTMTSV